MRADARVDDDAAVRRLLLAVPEAQEVEAMLARTFFVRAWDKNTNRDYWLKSNGQLASLFTLYGLNLKQAAAVRVRWDARSHELLNERMLAELVSAETARTVQVISYVISDPAVPFEPPW